MHCPGHHKGNSPEAKGNHLANETARQAALGPQLLTVTILSETDRNTQIPDWDYGKEDLDIIQKLGADYDPNRKHWIYQGKTVMPVKIAKELIDHLHKLTHLSARKMKALLE